MMSRGAFYPPIHSAVWGSAFGSNSKPYSGLSGGSSSSNGNGSSSGSNFGYPPTPPKDSTTPDHHQQQQQGQQGSAGVINNNNSDDYSDQIKKDLKPSSTDFLMSSINQLSNYASPYSHTSSAGHSARKLHEGSYNNNQNSYSSGSYYPSDLAMYGAAAAAYSARSATASALHKAKTKTRTNAGKKTLSQSFSSVALLFLQTSSAFWAKSLIFSPFLILNTTSFLRQTI